MKSKLILIEGLPGSGKTTTSQLAFNIFKEMNIPAKLFQEGNIEHPADYEYFSYFSKREFAHLLEEYKEFKTFLIENSLNLAHGNALSRGKMRQQLGETKLPETLQQKLWDNDIYEIDLEKHIDLITERWKGFCHKALNGDQTYIFECCFIQNPVTMAMIKQGAPDNVTMNYVKQLADIIKPLNPILIYVQQQDLRRSFKKAVEERSKEWSSGFIEYYNNQGYGKLHGAVGLEGTISVLEARSALEHNIYDALEMEKFKIDNTDFDMERHKASIVEKLMHQVR